MQHGCNYLTFAKGNDLMSRLNYKVSGDAISIGASLLCAVHCIALPIVFTTIPFLGIELIHNPYIESVTVLISMLIGGWAINHGYRKHHRKQAVLLLFITGILLLLIGNFLTVRRGEVILKLLGGIFLVTAHIKNWRAVKKSKLSKAST